MKTCSGARLWHLVFHPLLQGISAHTEGQWERISFGRTKLIENSCICSSCGTLSLLIGHTLQCRSRTLSSLRAGMGYTTQLPWCYPQPSTLAAAALCHLGHAQTCPPRAGAGGMGWGVTGQKGQSLLPVALGTQSPRAQRAGARHTSWRGLSSQS